MKDNNINVYYNALDIPSNVNNGHWLFTKSEMSEARVELRPIGFRLNSGRRR
jgi:hypothetical protein